MYVYVSSDEVKFFNFLVEFLNYFITTYDLNFQDGDKIRLKGNKIYTEIRGNLFFKGYFFKVVEFTEEELYKINSHD